MKVYQQSFNIFYCNMCPPTCCVLLVAREIEMWAGLSNRITSVQAQIMPSLLFIIALTHQLIVAEGKIIWYSLLYLIIFYRNLNWFVALATPHFGAASWLSGLTKLGSSAAPCNGPWRHKITSQPQPQPQLFSSWLGHIWEWSLDTEYWEWHKKRNNCEAEGGLVIQTVLWLAFGQDIAKQTITLLGASTFISSLLYCQCCGYTLHWVPCLSLEPLKSFQFQLTVLRQRAVQKHISLFFRQYLPHTARVYNQLSQHICQIHDSKPLFGYIWRFWGSDRKKKKNQETVWEGFLHLLPCTHVEKFWLYPRDICNAGPAVIYFACQ